MVAPGRDGFFKGEALGNDYIVLETSALSFPLTPRTIRALCDRSLGIGGDGVVALLDGAGAGSAERTVQVWNADGSLAEVSGNGLRIAALALGSSGEPQAAGTVLSSGGRRYRVTGASPGILAIDLAAAVIRDPRRPLEVLGRTLVATLVDVGNPHAVLEAGILSEEEWPAAAAAIAVHPAFPAGTNVERLQVTAGDGVSILIHERGVGPTRASGTGACAAAAAAVALGRVAAGRVRVAMPGGEVAVTVAADRLHLEGAVTALYRGTLDPVFARRLAAPA